MKKPLTLLTLALLCAAPILANSPRNSADQQRKHHETRMLHHLLEMEPADLANLRQTIERIEQMSPEEKAILRERIGRLEKMKPERVDAMRERFEAIAPEKREAMRQRWFDLSPEERRDWRQKLREMTHEERADIFEVEGFIPAMGKPPHRGEKPPRPPRK